MFWHGIDSLIMMEGYAKFILLSFKSQILTINGDIKEFTEITCKNKIS